MHEIKITQSNIRTDVISEKKNNNNHSYFIEENGLKIEKQSHSVRDGQQAEGAYIDLKKEGIEQSEELDPELEEAKKKGKEVKDFCNNK